MSQFSKIGWTDHTFNAHIGCQKVSPGCDHCYAEVERATMALGVIWGPGQPRHRTSTVNWRNPSKWHTAHEAFYAAHGRRQRVFCASLSDWADSEIPIEWTVDLLELVRTTTNLDWQMLTKRISNVVKRLAAAADWIREHATDTMSALLAWIEAWLAGDAPAHVWLGISVVNQEEADRDIPKLLATPAALRFVSMEPLLGPVVIAPYLPGWLWSQRQGGDHAPTIDWVIVGGESGPGARPMKEEWVVDIRDQCLAAQVPFFFKQWGGVQRRRAGRVLRGRTWDQVPLLAGSGAG